MRTGRQESASSYSKRSLPILGDKVTRSEGNDTWVKLAEKSDDSVVALKRVKARGAKGIMKMRTMKLEQLFMAFADSPQGGCGEEAPVPTGVDTPRLHKARDKEFEYFMAVPADVSQLMCSFSGANDLCALKYHPKSRMRDPLVRF